MPIKVILPAALARLNSGHDEVMVDAENVGQAIDKLIAQSPALRPVIVDAENRPLSYLQWFVNDAHIRDLDQFATKLGDGDELLIIAAIAGG